MHRLIAPRDQKHQSNFVEFRGREKIVYRRYAGLFFCACVDANDNELAYLEAIHFFVEVLDAFFGNVCELDLVFNFYKVGRGFLARKQQKYQGLEACDRGGQKSETRHTLETFIGSIEHQANLFWAGMLMNSSQVYAILDEVFLAGEIEETSKQVVLTRLEHLDKLE